VRCSNYGPGSRVAEGLHGAGAAAVDLLLTRGGHIEHLSAARLPTTLRGTGCVLASAISAGVAAQESRLDACSYAKRDVTEELHKGNAFVSVGALQKS
jgi:hydroxymethylpyrimidine/phosphomethylpyrimidine kinase